MTLPDISSLEHLTPHGTEMGLACWRVGVWGSNQLDPQPPERGDFDDVDALWVFLIGVMCVAWGAITATIVTGLQP